MFRDIEEQIGGSERTIGGAAAKVTIPHKGSLVFIEPRSSWNELDQQMERLKELWNLASEFNEEQGGRDDKSSLSYKNRGKKRYKVEKAVGTNLTCMPDKIQGDVKGFFDVITKLKLEALTNYLKFIAFLNNKGIAFIDHKGDSVFFRTEKGVEREKNPVLTIVDPGILTTEYRNRSEMLVHRELAQDWDVLSLCGIKQIAFRMFNLGYRGYPPAQLMREEDDIRDASLLIPGFVRYLFGPDGLTKKQARELGTAGLVEILFGYQERRIASFLPGAYLADLALADGHRGLCVPEARLEWIIEKSQEESDRFYVGEFKYKSYEGNCASLYPMILKELLS